MDLFAQQEIGQFYADIMPRRFGIERILRKRTKELDLLVPGCGSQLHSQDIFRGWLCNWAVSEFQTVTGVDILPNPSAPYSHHVIDLAENTERLLELGEGSKDVCYDHCFSTGNMCPALRKKILKRGESVQDFRERLRKYIGLLLRPNGIYLADKVLWQKGDDGILTPTKRIDMYSGIRNRVMEIGPEERYLYL